jgi:membrane-associated phospholipid phosphatase
VAREQTGPTEPGRRTDLTFIVGGLAVLVVGALIVRDGSVSDAEEAVFNAVNDLPDALEPVLWPVQQLGALFVGPIVAIVALVLRRYRLAIAAILATVAKLVLERVVKATVSRERPATSVGPDINARGDVSLSGESFVSGHAILITALAGVVSPYLHGIWKMVPWVLVGLVMVGRVYVGAHNPLDVICGAALGLVIAGAINLALRPRQRQTDPRAERSAIGV